MATATWPWWWPVQITNGSGVQYQHRVQEIQLGDNYSVTTESGPNSEKRTYALTFTGQTNSRHEKPQDVRDFLRQHVVHPFVFTPPDGIKGLFKVVVNTIDYKTEGGLVATVTADLVEYIGVV